MSSAAKGYHIGARIKIGLGSLIAFLLWRFINPSEDLTIAISFLLLSVFLIGWGLSFYFFWAVNALVHYTDNNILSDSYKMSLLFGFFVLINATLIFLEAWSRLLGFLILGFFVVLFVALFWQKKQRKYDR